MTLYSERQFNFNIRFLVCYVLAALILICCPLVGIRLVGLDVSRFTQFPPRTGFVVHAEGNWLLFWLGVAFFSFLLAPIISRLISAWKQSVFIGPAAPFPRWGWLAIIIMAVSWVVAWHIVPVSQEIRNWSFTPLWLGFILFVNALCMWRLGTCLLIRRPVSFLALFFLSSLFWWYFEFLNRFVENWHYIGVESFGPLKYSLMASLAFSTVLPAVLSVNEFLKALELFENAFEIEKTRWKPNKGLAFFILFVSSLGLGLIGLLPDYLFPLLWVSPLLIICSLKIILDIPNLLSGALSEANLGPLVRLASSGLVCGFFWEMWNHLSYPKWIYSIPFVGQVKIFEMPILGYMGYLPFGLECAAVAALVIPLKEIIRPLGIHTKGPKE